MANQPIPMTQEILNQIENYKDMISTGNRALFDCIFPKDAPCTLISVGTVYEGSENIYNDFVVGAICKSYSKIDLIADDTPSISFLNQDTAIAIFKYHTECIRRDDGSADGIQGVETQVYKRCGGRFMLVHVHYSKQ